MEYAMCHRISLLLAATSLLAVFGCASKFTRDNFNSIRVASDTRETVLEKLGEPNSDMGGDDTWYYEHEDRHDSAIIQFDELTGKVSGKQWMDSTGRGGIDKPTIWKELGVQ
jgi:outer membrane protein assembly factor BamE (lipoprotein component of BamABCDE complex)